MPVVPPADVMAPKTGPMVKVTQPGADLTIGDVGDAILATPTVQEPMVMSKESSDRLASVRLAGPGIAPTGALPQSAATNCDPLVNLPVSDTAPVAADVVLDAPRVPCEQEVVQDPLSVGVTGASGVAVELLRRDARAPFLSKDSEGAEVEDGRGESLPTTSPYQGMPDVVDNLVTQLMGNGVAREVAPDILEVANQATLQEGVEGVEAEVEAERVEAEGAGVEEVVVGESGVEGGEGEVDRVVRVEEAPGVEAPGEVDVVVAEEEPAVVAESEAGDEGEVGAEGSVVEEVRYPSSYLPFGMVAPEIDMLTPFAIEQADPEPAGAVVSPEGGAPEPLGFSPIHVMYEEDPALELGQEPVEGAFVTQETAAAAEAEGLVEEEVPVAEETPATVEAVEAETPVAEETSAATQVEEVGGAPSGGLFLGVAGVVGGAVRGIAKLAGGVVGVVEGVVGVLERAVVAVGGAVEAAEEVVEVVGEAMVKGKPGRLTGPAASLCHFLLLLHLAMACFSAVQNSGAPAPEFVRLRYPPRNMVMAWEFSGRWGCADYFGVCGELVEEAFRDPGAICKVPARPKATPVVRDENFNTVEVTTHAPSVQQAVGSRDSCLASGGGESPPAGLVAPPESDVSASQFCRHSDQLDGRAGFLGAFLVYMHLGPIFRLA